MARITLQRTWQWSRARPLTAHAWQAVAPTELRPTPPSALVLPTMARESGGPGAMLFPPGRMLHLRGTMLQPGGAMGHRGGEKPLRGGTMLRRLAKMLHRRGRMLLRSGKKPLGVGRM